MEDGNSLCSLCPCDVSGMKRSPARKLRQKKLAFDSSKDENDDDDINDDVSDVSEFVPFKKGTSGTLIPLKSVSI